MLDIFKNVLTFFRKQRVQTDSFVFRLHHSVTVALLLIFCLIVGLNQYVKSPIKCNSSLFPLDVLDVHCWTQSTFTVAEENRLRGRLPWGGVSRRQGQYKAPTVLPLGVPESLFSGK
jgi:hypothetical protein